MWISHCARFPRVIGALRPMTVGAAALLTLLLGGCGPSSPRSGSDARPVSERDVQDVQQILGQKNARAPQKDRAPVTLPPGTRFSREEIPREGGYVQIPLAEITDAQADRYLKRLKTEFCSCGCPHTIDQCLIDDPACSTARTLALQVLREVTTGTP